MIYLLYVSSATRLLGEVELIELLPKANLNDARDGIRGILILSYRATMQERVPSK